jgi:hypothetical protein
MSDLRRRKDSSWQIEATDSEKEEVARLNDRIDFYRTELRKYTLGRRTITLRCINRLKSKKRQAKKKEV